MWRSLVIGVLLGVLGGGCLGSGSSSHPPLAPGQVRAKLATVAHFGRAKVIAPDTTPCGAPTPKQVVQARYSVFVNDQRMPPYPQDTGRAIVAALVFGRPADAAACYKWLRLDDFREGPVADPNHPGQLIYRPLHPRKVGDYTMEVHPVKPGAVTATPGATGTYNTALVKGHTVVYGLSYTEPDAKLVEADAVKLLDVIGS